jgi:hypothetical protein
MVGFVPVHRGGEAMKAPAFRFGQHYHNFPIWHWPEERLVGFLRP